VRLPRWLRRRSEDDSDKEEVGQSVSVPVGDGTQIVQKKVEARPLNRADFAQAIASALGAPTGEAVIALVTDMTLEDTGAANNPMATEYPMPGATDWNSDGVKNYPTPAIGVTAIVKALENGLYDGILAAIRSGADATVICRNSEWNTWGGSDVYVSQLLDLLPQVRANYQAYGSTEVGGWEGPPPAPAPVPPTPAPPVPSLDLEEPMYLIFISDAAKAGVAAWWLAFGGKMIGVPASTLDEVASQFPPGPQRKELPWAAVAGFTGS
jgi:hypothetical protein